MQPRKLQCCIWRDSTKPSLRFSWFWMFFVSKGNPFLLLFSCVLASVRHWAVFFVISQCFWLYMFHCAVSRMRWRTPMRTVPRRFLCWSSSFYVRLITKTRLFKYIVNFISKNWKFLDKNFWYFSYFCSKYRLLVLVRTAPPRRF